ncbi:hypothetical protein M569_07144, partial [Genlisea aurea]
MQEIQSQLDHYRSSSSSSATSPTTTTGRIPSNFFYLRKPGNFRQPISFEDSPDWDDGEEEEEVRPASSSPPPQAKIRGASVVWRDLAVTISGKRKYSDRVIKSSNGYALPGTMTVIMGPAKSGKSTLLRTLAGQLPASARVYGEVFFNGVNSCLPYGAFGYVERETLVIESLTVREYLHYSALLQLHRRKGVVAVDDAIFSMSLGDCADKLIGGGCCYTRGLPSGERRRVAIARELIMRPHILFIDEPLYQLD